MTAKTIKYKIAHNSIKLGRKWGGAVSQAALGQVLFILLSFVVGLILVRHLDKKDYGVYTILNSIQAMILLLSNSNITTGFKTIGGKIWQDDHSMSSLINAANKLRKQLALIIIPLALLYGGYLLYKQGANTPILFTIYLFLIVISIIPDLKQVFLAEVFLLKSDVKTFQLTQNIQQGLRLFLISLVLLLTVNQLHLIVILIINAVATWLAFSYIRQKSGTFYNAGVPYKDKYYRELVYYPKKTWHNTLFFVFQHQILILILSVFGSVDSIAEFGALGRFAIITSFFIGIFSNVFVPAFARCQEYTKIFRSYLQLLMVFCLLSGIIISIVLLRPSIFLNILGDSYSNLTEELILSMTGAILNLIMTILYQLNSAKGWIDILSKFSIPTYLVTIFLGMTFLDLTTLKGILMLNIFLEISRVILQILNGWHGFSKYKKNDLHITQ